MLSEGIREADLPKITFGSTADMILREYCSAISQTRREIDSKKKFPKETEILPVKIKGINAYYYDLLFITRLTRGGSPWLDPIRRAGSELDNIKPALVNQILEILAGKQKRLSSDEFFST